MGRMKDLAIELDNAAPRAFDWQAEQLSDEQALDFDNFYAGMPEQFEVDEGMSPGELAQIESDADIFDCRLNGYA